MSLSRLILRSLRFYWKTALVAMFGIAMATAVITASLVVGDSVTGSLRDRALARLGSIDDALQSPHYFPSGLADRVASDRNVQGKIQTVLPLIITVGSVKNAESEAVVPNAAVMAVDSRFWGLYPRSKSQQEGQARVDSGGTPVESAGAPTLKGREAAVNHALAHDLGVKEGDSLVVRVDRMGASPSDALFARRRPRDTQRALRVRVVVVLPDLGAGGFKLDAASDVPRTVFLSREWLGDRIGKPGMANSLVAVRVPEARNVSPGVVSQSLQSALAAVSTLRDEALKLKQSPMGQEVSLQSGTLALSDSTADAAETAVHGSRWTAAPTSVYLATELRDGPRSTFYDMMAGVPDGSRFQFESGTGGKLTGTDAWINRWSADDLQAKVGDHLHMTYMVPAWDGEFRPASLELNLRGIVSVDAGSTDPGLTPDFEGITDAGRIDEWDAPFPVDRSRVTPRDEEFWRHFKAAPRLFVSMSIARSIWYAGPAGCNTDWITSVRLIPGGDSVARPGDSGSPSGQAGARPIGPISPIGPIGPIQQNPQMVTIESALVQQIDPAKAGLLFRPVRSLALEEAKGTTDFAGLFLSMSFFLVMAAVGLAGMLMRLSAERRASQAGVLLSTGFTQRTVSRVIGIESAIIVAAGAIAGSPLGILYASAIVHALNTWWSGAVGPTVLWLHVYSATIASGGISGFVVGLGSAVWAARAYRRSSPLQLLSGWQSLAVLPVGSRWKAHAAALALFLMAAGLVAASVGSHSLPPGEACFCSGAALMLSGLAELYAVLAGGHSLRAAGLSWILLAIRSAAANRGRSMLVAGLLSSAAFIVVAVSANTRDISSIDTTRKDSGVGGFVLQARSSMPIRFDFGTETGRKALGFSPDDDALFQGVEVFPFLVSPGEDISCLNLARPRAPRILGVSQRLIARGGFAMTPSANRHDPNPWTILNLPAESDGAISAFGDADSVTWTLNSRMGEEYKTASTTGLLRMRFLGMLSRSIFASELLISADNFRQAFPDVSSPRYFLIAAPPDRADRIAACLRRNLGDLGLEVRSTREVLNGYDAVENTYISMFLALGGLGLLMGTLGMGAVILRSALDRRREWALMLAIGFTHANLRRLLVLENAGLLVIGVVMGAISGLVATASQLINVSSGVHWSSVIGLLSGMVIIGLGSCVLAARAAVGGALVAALHEEA